MSYSQRFGTTYLRELWCHHGGQGSEFNKFGMSCQPPGNWFDTTFYGKKIGGTPTVAVDAFRALERALISTGYKAESVWAYNARPIASSGLPSLHGYGIAIDIDPNENPQADVPPFSGKFTPAQVDAALGIKTGDGNRVWWWGGLWTGITSPDLMHWQLDCTPVEALTIDWTTVPRTELEPPPQEDEMVLKEGATGNAVKSVQRALNNWSELNNKGWSVAVDGKWEANSKMTDRVKEFQKALNLEVTGEVDGLTASFLVGRYDPPKIS